MAMMEITVIPLGEGSSVSKYVARAVKALEKEKAIKFQTTPMGTIVEGEITVLFEIARKMHLAVKEADVKRVSTTIHIDDRTDKEVTLNGKIESLNKALKAING